MAEYRSYRGRNVRSRRGKRGEEQGDAITVALTAQLLVCVLLIAAAVFSKKADEIRYSSFRVQYNAMVGQSSEELTVNYIEALTGGAKAAFSAVTKWVEALASSLVNGKPIRFQQESAPEIADKEGEGDISDAGAFDYSYLQKDDKVSLTGAGGWYPVIIGGKEARQTLAAPKDAVLSPVTLSARVKPPVSGPITSAFSYRYHPITGTSDFHTGIDIAAGEGRSILAALPGEVVEVGESAVYGNYIIMQHATNLKTFYAHCSEIIAQEGMALRQGERIAKVGQTGTATGPHLHFSVIVDGLYSDPYWVLGDNIQVVN